MEAGACICEPNAEAQHELEMKIGLIVLLAIVLGGCESSGECADQASLLATTAGSPNFMTCPHPKHRMHVQVASVASNEEAAALVFCECERDK